MLYEQTVNRDARPKPAPLSTEYPKYLHHPSGKSVKVANAAEEAKLDKSVWGPKPHPQFIDEPKIPGDKCSECANMRARFDHAYSRLSRENLELNVKLSQTLEEKNELQNEVAKLTEANEAWAAAERCRLEAEPLILPHITAAVTDATEDPALKMIESAPAAPKTPSKKK